MSCLVWFYTLDITAVFAMDVGVIKPGWFILHSGIKGYKFQYFSIEAYSLFLDLP